MDIKRPESKQPMPPHAKCVFKGILFEVYQWEQKQFDGSIKIFEKIKRADTVSVIPITTDGKFIITNQEQPGTIPFKGFPGGILDFTEDPYRATKRELLEETGYKSENISLWFATQPTSKVDWAVYIFIAKDCERVQDQHVDSGERIHIAYISFDELMNLISSDEFRDSEIALRIFKIKQLQNGIGTLKKLFLA